MTQAKFRFSDKDRRRMYSIVSQAVRAIFLAFHFLKLVKYAEKGYKTH